MLEVLGSLQKTKICDTDIKAGGLYSCTLGKRTKQVDTQNKIPSNSIPSIFSIYPIYSRRLYCHFQVFCSVYNSCRLYNCKSTRRQRKCKISKPRRGKQSEMSTRNPKSLPRLLLLFWTWCCEGSWTWWASRSLAKKNTIANTAAHQSLTEVCPWTRFVRPVSLAFGLISPNSSCLGHGCYICWQRKGDALNPFHS